MANGNFEKRGQYEAAQSLLISNQKIHEHAGRFHLLDGGEIYYQIIGQEGPWVTAVPGGRHSHTDLKGLAQENCLQGISDYHP